MKHTSAAALGILVSFATCPANADTITDWNQTAIAVLKTANVVGNPWTRSMAMVHVAMSDAVNSVQGRYARYVAKGELARDASAEVAAASAARQILLQLYPAQKPAIDEAFSSRTVGLNQARHLFPERDARGLRRPVGHRLDRGVSMSPVW